mgnify:CR=1 FL=1
MAIMIEKGKSYTALYPKNGNNEKGVWGLFTVEQEKQKATVYVRNAAACIVKEGDEIMINDILTASISKKEYPKGSGKWYSNLKC